MSDTPSSEPPQQASIAGSRRSSKQSWSANSTRSQREPAFAVDRGDDPFKDAAPPPLQDLAAQFERTAAELAQLQGMPPDKVASVLDAARAHMMQEVFGEREAALQYQTPSPPPQPPPQTPAAAPQAQVWSPRLCRAPEAQQASTGLKLRSPAASRAGSFQLAAKPAAGHLCGKHTTILAAASCRSNRRHIDNAATPRPATGCISFRFWMCWINIFSGPNFLWTESTAFCAVDVLPDSSMT